jgi:two-component system, LytTR family, response regulator
VIRALIVDDEPPARAELRYQLETHPDVQVVGEATSVREALELVEAVRYDVVFLDIEMPGRRGLDLAALHGGLAVPPFIVFVTAHDEHALVAHDLAAVDYLLKPVTPHRLNTTLARLRLLKGRSEDESGAGVRANGPAAADPGAGQAAQRFLSGLDGDRTVPVPLEGISYLAAEGDTVCLWQTDEKRLVVRRPLQELERMLPSNLFLRCHRAYIVNLSEVAEITPFFNGTYLLRMKGPTGAQVPVSRKNARHIRELFHL